MSRSEPNGTDVLLEDKLWRSMYSTMIIVNDAVMNISKLLRS